MFRPQLSQFRDGFWACCDAIEFSPEQEKEPAELAGSFFASCNAK